jgi:hypothetical protein
MLCSLLHVNRISLILAIWNVTQPRLRTVFSGQHVRPILKGFPSSWTASPLKMGAICSAETNDA